MHDGAKRHNGRLVGLRRLGSGVKLPRTVVLVVAHPADGFQPQAYRASCEDRRVGRIGERPRIARRVQSCLPSCGCSHGIGLRRWSWRLGLPRPPAKQGPPAPRWEEVSLSSGTSVPEQATQPSAVLARSPSSSRACTALCGRIPGCNRRASATPSPPPWRCSRPRARQNRIRPTTPPAPN